MKKILLFFGLLFLVIELNAHGACLLENLKKESSCTGAAADIKKLEDTENIKKEKDNIYQNNIKKNELNKNNSKKYIKHNK